MTGWEIAGWLGNGCFFARVVVQWVGVEVRRHDMPPAAYWWLSLGGALLVGGYALSREAIVLLPSFFVTGAIYARNLRMRTAGDRAQPLAAMTAPAVGLAAAAILVAAAWIQLGRADESLLWLGAAIVGQSIWGTRFLVQWWMSERAGRSHFPAAFWWMTLAGSLFNIGYALHLRDTVLVVGYALTPLYPIRNLWLQRSDIDVAT